MSDIAELLQDLAKECSRVSDSCTQRTLLIAIGEIESLRQQLTTLKVENETAWAQARCLAFQLQKTQLSSANGGVLGW